MLSARGAGPAAAKGTVPGGAVGRGQAPKRARISRRASSMVTAPTIAMIVVSGRAWRP